MIEGLVVAVLVVVAVLAALAAASVRVLREVFSSMMTGF